MNKEQILAEDSIYSMTAFSRVTTQGDFGTVTWEIRSVNHRHLDVDIRMPHFLSELEVSLRDKLRQQLRRGRVICHLRYVSGDKAGLKLQVNETFMQQYVSALQKLQDNVAKNCSESINLQVNLPSVLSHPQAMEESKVNEEAVNNAVVENFEKALKEFLVARAREGAEMKRALKTILEQIAPQVEKARGRQEAILTKQREKVLGKFEELKANLDPMRLEQEMVLFAQRADVSEELERLEVHLKEFHRVIDKGGVIGKRLDFLVQELNREANTLASKSNDVDATYAAVEIKVLLEQIREQLQNLE